MKINKDNFFESTACNWKEVETPANFEADYISPSGSKYMYTEEGVYRVSDHWNCGVATCSWLLDGLCYEFSTFLNGEIIGTYKIGGEIVKKEKYKTLNETDKCGFAKWEDFTYENDIFKRVEIVKNKACAA